jgi:hypothetical protein
VIKDADKNDVQERDVGASAKLIDGDLEDDPVAQEDGDDDDDETDFSKLRQESV